MRTQRPAQSLTNVNFDEIFYYLFDKGKKKDLKTAYFGWPDIRSLKCTIRVSTTLHSLFLCRPRY